MLTSGVQAQSTTLRFGVFEVNLRSGELRKHGLRVRLPGQPFKILTILLQQPGEIVTREELRNSLWPTDTFVDFEHGLNSAIKRLRTALGDSADNPRYIETLPRVGYRLIAPVNVAQHTGAAELPDTRVPATASEHPPLAAAPPRSIPWKWILVCACGLAALAVGLMIVRQHRPKTTLAETDFVLISDFVNTTGDSIFDGTLKQALAIKLAESPKFNLIPDATVRETLKLMGRSPDERVVPPISREVCQRSGGKVVVGGAILGVGGKYLINLQAVNCATGESLVREEVEVPAKDQALNGLGRIVPPLRRKLGESVASIAKFNTPIEQATTKSLAALKAYTSGDEKRAQGQEAESITAYKLAIDLDPNFAIAYARIAAIYGNLGEIQLASQYMSKAYERRDNLSEREKYYVVSHYYVSSTGETEKAIEAYKLWTRTYPRDWIPFQNLCNELARIGRPDQAIKPCQEALRLNPNHSFPYAGLAFAYLRSSRFAEAKAILDKALSQKRDSFVAHSIIYEVAFVEGDEPTKRREIEWFESNPMAAWGLNVQAWAAFSEGQVHRGRELFERSRTAARGEALTEYAAQSANDQAQLEADLGNVQQARQMVGEALRLMPKSREAQAGGGIALARVGDLRRAEDLLAAAREQFPRDTLMNFCTLAEGRAALDIERKNPDRAIEDLRAALRYDLSDAPGAPSGLSLYYRGLAFIAAGAGKSAAIEFQKLIDNRGVAATSLYWPLAHLGLARACALTGETEKSLRAYGEFLALWKNADRDVRTLKQAQTEYAALGRRLQLSAGLNR